MSEEMDEDKKMILRIFYEESGGDFYFQLAERIAERVIDYWDAKV